MSNTVVFVLVGLLLLVGLLTIVIYNRLVTLSFKVTEAFSQIQVQLKRRSDLIPNLIESVKGYASHEKTTFDAVVVARSKATSATSVTEVSAADGMLTQALRGLLAVAEAYPDLKASENFLSLQEELSTTENKIAFSRQFYNDNVRLFNTTINTIPSKFVADLMKYQEKEFYELEDPSLADAPTVKF